MQRTYLEEDLDLIQKYFPGARTVQLRTPFDLTRTGQHMPRLDPSSFQDSGTPHDGWSRGAAWTN